MAIHFRKKLGDRQAVCYDGTKDDLEQDLLGVYDGTIGDNESWSA